MSDETRDEAVDEPLDALRARLAEVGSLPLVERPDVFAEVNQALVAELSAMEEV